MYQNSPQSIHNFKCFWGACPQTPLDVAATWVGPLLAGALSAVLYHRLKAGYATDVHTSKSTNNMHVDEKSIHVSTNMASLV